MTVEADIVTLLKGLVGDRFYPDVAPAVVTRPYGTFQQVGGRGVGFLGVDVPSKQNGRFQINFWAATRAAAASLALQAENLLIASALQATALGAPTALHDETTNLYGTRQDFSIWSNR